MQCFQYFLRLLSRREYSTNELLRKGKEKGFTQEEIAEAIYELQSKDYQSDQRLVAQMIAASAGRYGKSRVKSKCLEKGISLDLFEQIWEQQEVAEDDTDLADLKAKVIRKYKIQDIQNIEPKTKAKLLNYLKYRGFNAFAVLGQWQREE